ncbi:MAG: hypothetical protein P8X62_12445 [Flavobacteriaceae bacterium]|jgi:hypothetical protein
MNANNKSKFLAYFLGILQALIGLTAIAGGFRLISNPNGIPDFPIEWLSNSPFNNYFIPGLVLLIVIGLGNVLAGTVTFLRKRYSGSIAIVLGIFLILYMATEVWFVGLRNFLQPLYFILGVIVLILGLKLFKSATIFRIESA